MWNYFLFLRRRTKKKDKNSIGDGDGKSYMNPNNFVFLEGITANDLNQLVQLPSGLDANEWIATNCRFFFKKNTCFLQYNCLVRKQSTILFHLLVNRFRLFSHYQLHLRRNLAGMLQLRVLSDDERSR